MNLNWILWTLLAATSLVGLSYYQKRYASQYDVSVVGYLNNMYGLPVAGLAVGWALFTEDFYR